MIVASFLTKHLLVHWVEGERWFWDCLLDADIASNACSWQWVPAQERTLRPTSGFLTPLRRDRSLIPRAITFVGGVRNSQSSQEIYSRPWEAPALTLASAGVELGTNYPMPIVDHKTARQGALDAYEVIKKAS